MPHKSLAKITAARSRKTEDVFKQAKAFYNLGVAYERAGKAAQAAAAYKQAQKLMKQASRAGMLAGPVGRLPNPRKRKPRKPRGVMTVLGGYDLDMDRNGHLIRKHLPDRVPGRDYGTDPVGDGVHVRMVPSGEIVTIEEARRRLKRNPAKGISQKELEQILSKATPQARAQIERQLSENEAPIIRRPLRAPQFGSLSAIPRGATKVRLKSGQQISRVQRLNPSGARDSAGAVDVIRYFASPGRAMRGYGAWYVKGVRVNEDGREVESRNAVPFKTKRDARHTATMLNNELKRLGRYRAINPGLIDLAANLQAAQTVKDLITPKRKRNSARRKPKYKIGDLVFSYQNRDYKAPVNYIMDNGEGYAYSYRLSLKGADQYSVNSNWINEESLYKSKRLANPSGADSSVRSPTRTSTEVRSPTKTSTQAHTAGNITVTGGAGAGANTTVVIRRRNAIIRADQTTFSALKVGDKFTLGGKTVYEKINSEQARYGGGRSGRHWKYAGFIPRDLVDRLPTKNPSIKEVSKIFQGAASGKVSELKAANSAPADLARIGKLIFVKLAGAKAQTRIPGAMVAVDKSGKLWLCGSPASVTNGMFKRKAKPGEALDYGYVDQVCYQTTKKHLDGVPTEYVHAFGEEGGKRPRLLVDHEGMPILRGGDYKITADGIVN